jgi:hypothetical protein
LFGRPEGATGVAQVDVIKRRPRNRHGRDRDRLLLEDPQKSRYCGRAAVDPRAQRVALDNDFADAGESADQAR